MSRRYVVIDRSDNRLVSVRRRDADEPGGVLSSTDVDKLYDVLCLMYGDPQMEWMRDRFVVCPAAARADAVGEFLDAEVELRRAQVH